MVNKSSVSLWLYSCSGLLCSVQIMNCSSSGSRPVFFPGLSAHLLVFSPKQMGCTPSLWLLPWQNANVCACSQRWSSAQRTSWGVAWVLTVFPVCCSSIQSLWSHDPEGVHQEPEGAASQRVSVWVRDTHTHTHTHTHTQLQSRLLQRLLQWKK